MKKITYISLLFLTSLLYSQPANYYMNPNFGPDGSFSIDSPVSGIVNRTIQATGTDPNFYIEWDSQFNEWYNTSIDLNQEFVLTFEGLDGLNNSSTLNTAPNVNSYYTIQIEGLAYSNRNAVIMETTNAPISFDGTTPVSAVPTVYPGQDLSLTITFSGAKSSEEKAFIRYSDDGYSTSFVSEVTFTGANDSSGSGIIPGTFNTASKSVSFYVYTTTVSATDSSNHDLISLNLANNSGSNYSYAVESSWTTSATDGSWNDSGSWVAGEVPVSSQPVTITNNITVSTDVVSGDVTINSGGSISVNPGKSLTVQSNLTNNGSITLNSSSTTYSSLIPTTMSGTGTVSYKRWVDSDANGRDLIAAPLHGQAFNAFYSANSANLVSSAGTVLFGPFDNAANPGVYVNYSDSETTTLSAGKGYRAASANASGSTLTFTGTVETGDLTGGSAISITDNIGSYGSWNLIGNPYSSYLSFKDFYDLIIDEANTNTNNQLDGTYSGLYGYDSDVTGTGVWTIWDKNNTNYTTDLIAPGQGFFVKAKTGGGTASFTNTMRQAGTSDDFISGRDSNSNFAQAKLNLTNTGNSYSTNIYFRDNNTRGLDPGYDTGAYDQSSLGIYTQLVEENNGINLANQSLPYIDLNDIAVPLVINADQGVQISVGLDVVSTLPENINVYLEDNVANTWILLNTGDYVFTPSSALSGSGRFFLHFTTVTLSAEDAIFSGLQIFADNAASEVVIKGHLSPETTANIYDLLGREVINQKLDNLLTTNKINVNSLSSGLYIVELRDYNKNRIQKVIIK